MEKYFNILAFVQIWMKHTIQLWFCTKDKVTLIFLKMVIKEINSMFSPDYVQDTFVPKPTWRVSQDRSVISSYLLAKLGQKELVGLLVASKEFLCS